MKVAYHFKCADIQGRYDKKFYELLFCELLNLKEPFISTKVLTGDLVLYDCLDKFDTPNDLIFNLFQIKGDNWKRIIIEKYQCFIEENVFVICFETLQKEVADKIHNCLKREPNYLGAFEIINSLELHWWLYGECIGPHFRILDNEVNILLHTENEEGQETFEHFKELLAKVPFKRVNKELSNYRYSLLDDNHNYENAKRAAEWKKSTESIFETITDQIISKLTDAAPELTDRLWTINNTFLNAQTGEQYALAMTSCRRLFEYITDCLFPAQDKIVDGHSLQKDKYKNRLFEFAKRELRSETNIDLIVTNTVSLFNEWEKLYELSNKGVHSEPHRQECRRCIIRTILLLDDLITIKKTPFETNVKAESFFNDFWESRNASD